MNPSDLVLISTSLFLGACALFVPYLSEIVKRRALAAKPRVKFRHCPPFCHKTTWGPPSDAQSQSNEAVYYFRFKVVNEGKSRANECEVVLEKLWIYDSSQTPRLHTNFSPVNMVWVDDRTKRFVHINPCREIFCDIGHISSPAFQESREREGFIVIPGSKANSLQFMLDLSRYFYCQPNCLGPGRYILQVGFYSENAGKQKAFLDISWSGKWQDTEKEMFRELVIDMCPEPAHQ